MMKAKIVGRSTLYLRAWAACEQGLFRAKEVARLCRHADHLDRFMAWAHARKCADLLAKRTLPQTRRAGYV